ncbi:MAG: cyclic nucleotide-binding domain-containing protein [Steroidobacteraceae bacterium]
MSDDRRATVKQLQGFSPLGGMKRDNLAALAKKVAIREVSAGRLLFKEGENDRRTVWLVSGTVELRNSDRVIGVIRAGTPEAQSPLAPSQPRKCSARAVEDIEFLAIDSELLDVMIVWDQTGSYEVSELRSEAEAASDGDWMTTLLSSNAFQRIPPANIQAIFMKMQRLPYREGDVVIKQGDEGDYFYAIVSGKCLVTRETPMNKEGLKLAELGVGDTFGEEALISEAKRNATVRMATDGVLVRLGKQEFRELMNEPMLHWVDDAEARRIVADGGQWLDVRLPSEFQNMRLDNSLNIPLYFIRLKTGTLDTARPYVVVCDTGRRSSAAAYILVNRGFKAYVLKGGISSATLPLRRAPG